MLVGCAGDEQDEVASQSDPLTSGYVAAYAFSEGTGTTTADQSANRFNGTLSGVTWSPQGKFGQALQFSGAASSYVEIADNPALRMTRAFTLSAWVKPTSLSGAPTVVFKHQKGGLTYALYAGGHSGPAASVTKSSTSVSAAAASALSLNAWTHLAATYDGSSLRIYVNGALASTKAVAAPINSSTGVLRIGNNSVHSGEGFIGLIDEVRIFNRAQSAAEIENDMAVPISGAADTAPPAGSIVINSSEATNSTAVTLTLSATDSSGVTQMRLSNDGVTFGAPVAYATNAAWTLTSGDGPKTVYVQFKDTAGNWSGSFSDTIMLDTVPPELSAVTATSLTASSATITWVTSQPATSTVNEGTTTSYGTDASSSGLATSHSVLLSGLSASTTYHFRVRSSDAAGNEAVGADATFTTTSSSSPSSSGATVVGTQAISFRWGDSGWSTSSIAISGVQTGDAIVVVAAFWTSNGPNVAPSDSNGTLTAAVNQAPSYTSPPVVAQIFYELNASAGTHHITAPALAYGGDGMLYVLLVRGLSGTFVASGSAHATGTALPSIATQLSTNASPGDFVVAIGCEDDSVSGGTNVAMSGPPAGWSAVGVQNDSDNYVPSSTHYRIVASPGPQPVSWSWNDRNANVTCAAMAALR
ncbi:MAG TPA: LamG-like jellyroll fold domain-containing protein [Polyangia bacterium]|nr:LamG-like jellyroll fold domain-containing protein [Polyangia bacterium]